jgi:hypothetical protein
MIVHVFRTCIPLEAQILSGWESQVGKTEDMVIPGTGRLCSSATRKLSAARRISTDKRACVYECRVNSRVVANRK